MARHTPRELSQVASMVLRARLVAIPDGMDLLGKKHANVKRMVPVPACCIVIPSAAAWLMLRMAVLTQAYSATAGRTDASVPVLALREKEEAKVRRQVEEAKQEKKRLALLALNQIARLREPWYEKAVYAQSRTEIGTPCERRAPEPTASDSTSRTVRRAAQGWRGVRGREGGRRTEGRERGREGRRGSAARGAGEEGECVGGELRYKTLCTGVILWYETPGTERGTVVPDERSASKSR
eukprot:3210493-Rhodomonas_salina.2